MWKSSTSAFPGIFGLLIEVLLHDSHVIFRTKAQKLYQECKDLLRDPSRNLSPVAMSVFSNILLWTKTLSSPHHLQFDVSFEPGVFLVNVNIREKGETENYVLEFTSFYVTYFLSYRSPKFKTSRIFMVSRLPAWTWKRTFFI